MVKLNLNLNSVEKVKEFINIISKENDDYDLTSGGRYIVDAKSIMGIFSLNLSGPVILLSRGGDQIYMENKLHKFIQNSDRITVIDPKGELLRNTSKALVDNGYDVLSL